MKRRNLLIAAALVLVMMIAPFTFTSAQGAVTTAADPTNTPSPTPSLTATMTPSPTFTITPSITPSLMPTPVAPPCLPLNAPAVGSEEYGTVMVTVDQLVPPKFFVYYRLFSVVDVPGAYCAIHGELKVTDREMGGTPDFSRAIKFDFITSEGALSTLTLYGTVFTQIVGISEVNLNQISYLLQPDNAQNSVSTVKRAINGKIGLSVDSPVVRIQFGAKETPTTK